jgi:hypothetical protein
MGLLTRIFATLFYLEIRNNMLPEMQDLTETHMVEFEEFMVLKGCSKLAKKNKPANGMDLSSGFQQDFSMVGIRSIMLSVMSK